MIVLCVLRVSVVSQAAIGNLPRLSPTIIQFIAQALSLVLKEW
jgi:hypothetical protein